MQAQPIVIVCRTCAAPMSCAHKQPGRKCCKSWPRCQDCPARKGKR